MCIALATLLVVSALPAFAQSSDDTALLLQRLASGGGHADVFVDKLPPSLPQVPLPNAKVVGSVHQTTDAPLATDSYKLYYVADADALARYGKALAAAGWKSTPLPFAKQSGFVASSGPQIEIYCKSDAPTITATLGENPQDLAVSIVAKNATTGILCNSKGPMDAMLALTGGRAPLPALEAPAGTKLTTSPLTDVNSGSTAYIRGGATPAELIADFSKQMAAAGWKAGTPIASAASASQTFTDIDAKKTVWSCVITISAIDGKPGEFVAFIGTANLDKLAE